MAARSPAKVPQRKPISGSTIVHIPRHSDDTPRPPKIGEDVAMRLIQVNRVVAATERDLHRAKLDIYSRRSALFESIDPVLLPLKLLPEELRNVHACIRQALEWNYLSCQEKEVLEAAFREACAEVSFAVQNVAFEEQNYFLGHKNELIYSATEEDRRRWQSVILNMADVDDLKALVAQMFPLGEQLKSEVQRLGAALQGLTKLRIRCKKLLYEAMEEAMQMDEALGKTGITMNVLLHPWWN
ncbi:uncharacterized protein PV09_06767 [Verruconis gallopava]|uniref:Uncharacterized protein n=1 Tax=Verruconis gallopava TaxID=253628 RepID=A0A0D1XI31_9PEZI|nr:uncharacterized protein PV09_06767 [Verruconis gallopava]KIW01926.1 hypothetical protein PV09_06767 [Verruconis gallopava]